MHQLSERENERLKTSNPDSQKNMNTMYALSVFILSLKTCFSQSERLQQPGIDIIMPH